jgi:hypothetical protein
MPHALVVTRNVNGTYRIGEAGEARAEQQQRVTSALTPCWTPDATSRSRIIPFRQEKSALHFFINHRLITDNVCTHFHLFK